MHRPRIATINFNPRSPRGLRHLQREKAVKILSFQSTQPEWAATHHNVAWFIRCSNFNPRSPSGLRPKPSGRLKIKCLFQSTQPEWAATVAVLILSINWLFQSTQPEWAATRFRPTLQNLLVISIHAARVGCDISKSGIINTWKDFNPRSPSGLRLSSLSMFSHSSQFQSTQPEWAATINVVWCHIRSYISIHAARVGCNGALCRELNLTNISIHAAQEGCDQQHCGRPFCT